MLYRSSNCEYKQVFKVSRYEHPLTNLLYRQSHVVGIVQFGVALDGARSSNPTAEQRACQLALGVAVSPARQSRLGALRHSGSVLGRRGEQVNIAKFVASYTK